MSGARRQHVAVGALIANAARTRFVVQQKDRDYRPHPRGFSCFGGAIEPGEVPGDALARELAEELGEAMAAQLLAAALREVLRMRVEPAGFEFVLFELIVDDALIDDLAEHPVLEGERAVVVERGQLLALAWVWGLEQVVAAYLTELKRPPAR